MSSEQNPLWEGACTYKRTDGVWVLYKCCDDPNPTHCPRIPNSRTQENSSSFEPDLEAVFRLQIRDALEDQYFDFVDGDSISIGCEPLSSVLKERAMRYSRGEKAFPLMCYTPMRPLVSRGPCPVA